MSSTAVPLRSQGFIPLGTFATAESRACRRTHSARAMGNAIQASFGIVGYTPGLLGEGAAATGPGESYCCSSVREGPDRGGGTARDALQAYQNGVTNLSSHRLRCLAICTGATVS